MKRRRKRFWKVLKRDRVNKHVTSLSISTEVYHHMNMKLILKIQGGSELLALILFLVGYFSGNWILMMIGGIMLVIGDIIEMSMGILNPTFPLIFAFILAFVFDPWYVGIFWSIAVFTLFNIPTDIKKLFMTQKVINKYNGRLGDLESQIEDLK